LGTPDVNRALDTEISAISAAGQEELGCLTELGGKIWVRSEYKWIEMAQNCV
jgi:hypothetical protein